MNQEDKSMNSGEVMVGGKRLQVQAAQGQPSLKSQKRKQKHLYLVLYDWNQGYTIRKIDDDGDIRLDLSDPPLLRLASPAPNYRMFSNQHPATLAYDTDTAALAAGPSLPDALLNNRDILVVPAADKLYAFGHHRDRAHSVEVMSSSSSPKQHPWPCISSLIPSRDWSWRSVAPLPFTEGEVIDSYAVHPDGRTVFVSSSFSRIFSFDAGNGSGSGWSFHGDWELPFEGQGYFDSDLDAWVGLDLDGYIGTCQVPSRSTGGTAEQLDWKTAKDKLWNEEQHLEPTLTCMGNARFCLVDSVEGELQITTLRLRYSRKGELQIIDRSTSSCPVPKHTGTFSPVAFWI